MENANRSERRKKAALIKRRRRLFALLVLSSIIISLLTHNFFVRARSQPQGRTKTTAVQKEAILSSEIKSQGSIGNPPIEESVVEKPASEGAKGQSQPNIATSKTFEIKPKASSQDANVIAASSEIKSPTFSAKTICIDPGHQSKANLVKEPIGPGSKVLKAKVTGGTSGVTTRIPEYEVNLQVAMRLKDLLEAKGYKVIMTREKNDVNISNAERAGLANEAGADLVVRIHADGNADQSVRGVSILYPAKNEWTGGFYLESKSAAGAVLSEIIKATGAENDGIVARGDITGFNWSKEPVILVEMGYLTNKDEDKLLTSDDYQKKMAQGIFNGIEKFFN